MTSLGAQEGLPLAGLPLAGLPLSVLQGRPVSRSPPARSVPAQASVILATSGFLSSSQPFPCPQNQLSVFVSLCESTEEALFSDGDLLGDTIFPVGTGDEEKDPDICWLQVPCTLHTSLPAVTCTPPHPHSLQSPQSHWLLTQWNPRPGLRPAPLPSLPAICPPRAAAQLSQVQQDDRWMDHTARTEHVRPGLLPSHPSKEKWGKHCLGDAKGTTCVFW